MSGASTADGGLASLEAPSTTSSASQFPVLHQLGIGNVVRIWEMSEPAPRNWVVAGLVPAEAVTLLYGDGGTGKSYLALFLAVQALRGADFLGVSVDRQEAVLYVDAELDDREFCRRAYQVARGLGLESPPLGLHYLRLPGPLTDAACRTELHKAVHDCRATLTLFDSITVAASGSDVKEAGVATALMETLARLGTVVAVDHIAKPLPATSQSDYRPFGSVFKYNLGRSVLQVVRADGGGLMVRQTKSNFGPLAKPIGAAVEFGDRTVTFTSIRDGDDRLAGIEAHLPAADRVARALVERGPATPEDLGQYLGMSPKTVRNYLSVLRPQGRAGPAGDGRWTVPNSRDPTEREQGTPGGGNA